MPFKRIRNYIVKDKCEVCNGDKGGIPGNENIHYISVLNSSIRDVVIACDYCSAKWFS